MNHRSRPRRSLRVTAASIAALALIAASCGGDDDDSTPPESSSSTAEETTGDEPTAEPATEPAGEPATDEPAAEPADASADEPAEDEPSAEPSADEGSADEPAGEPAVADIDDFRTYGPPTGEPIVFGLVNTEGVPGLDFPEMRTDTDLAVAYLNEHGGVGGRPLEVVHCTTAGSPETSQACAQELAGSGVDLVMLGLDLFPGYDTYAASGLPVVGALPILPGDYSANALFITGGNATTMAAMVAFAVEEIGASTAGIVSADNPGANSSEASLIAALDKAGITYVAIKGGDNETDAGFQGLLRQANSDNPDVLFSLYADAGCVGTMRGRVALGIDTPAITTPICSSAEVIDVVGDDAVGWYFVGAGGPEESPAGLTLEAIIEPAYGPDATGSLGLSALAINNVMTLARVGNYLAAEGAEVTGQAIYDRLATADDIRIFQGDNFASCGASEVYATVCDFVFPVSEYIAGGELVTVPGFEAKSVVDYLP